VDLEESGDRGIAFDGQIGHPGHLEGAADRRRISRDATSVLLHTFHDTPAIATLTSRLDFFSQS
jgi:hypothetical protein